MHRVVVGVDESEGAAAALRWAVREAAVRKQAVTALLAWGLLDQHGGDSVPFDPDFGEPEALAALDRIVTAALGAEAAPGVERRAVCDLPAPALLDAAAGADLLVVGARGMGGFKGLLLGSVSRRVLHRATVPVAVVRGDGEDRGSGRIVVAVDGSAVAAGALAWALDEARARDAVVTAVHAWHPSAVRAFPFETLAVDPAVFAQASREILDAAVAGADTGGLREPVETRSVQGTAASAVLDAAQGADLVVVGSRGLGAVAGLVLGSVAAQVVSHSPTTVVVVPPAGS